MNKKTEESRIAYNKIASEYDTSREGQYTRIQANGLDVSENMIHVAKTCYPDMSFKIQPCYPLEWSDESIDIITICCAFHHFDHPQGFVNECKRVRDIFLSFWI